MSTALCPICEHEATRLLNQFSLEDVAEFFTPTMLDAGKFQRMKSELSQLWASESVKVMKCDACDFGFAHPFVAGTAEFYHLEAPDTPYPKDKWEYQRTLRALEGRSGAQSRLIDIGAGKGHFLALLLKNGWSPAQLTATEYSQTGKDAIEKLGVRCIQSDVRAFATADAFDIVCMFQVLEHLDGYDDLFKAIDLLGRPTMDLFVAVPNGLRIDFNEALGLQYDCPPNHISRWSPRSFDVLAAKFGWTVRACELEPPTTMLQEAVYGAINRYIRNSHVKGSWAQLTYCLADRLFNRSGRANKLFKAATMSMSPDVWGTAVRVASKAKRGGIPHALWVNLRRG